MPKWEHALHTLVEWAYLVAEERFEYKATGYANDAESIDELKMCPESSRGFRRLWSARCRIKAFDLRNLANGR